MLEAELWAIFHALNLAREVGLRHLITESDSINAVGLIKNSPVEYHPAYPIVKKILILLQRDWQVFISHIMRGANKPADFCAKAGLSKPLSFQAITTPSLELEQLLKEDSAARQWVRKCKF